MVAMGYLGKQMRRAYRDVQQALAEVNAGVEQGVAGMRVVQSLSRESFTVAQFESLSLRNMKANLRAGPLFAAVFPTMTVTNMLGVALSGGLRRHAGRPGRDSPSAWCWPSSATFTASSGRCGS